MSESFYITCPKGLEELLQTEAQTFGLEATQTVGAIFAEGELFDVQRFCLFTRFANRVIWILSDVYWQDADSLYRQCSSLLWMRYFDVTQTIAVDFRGTNKFINHSNYGAQRVKDAIVDHFTDRVGERPFVDPKNPDVQVYFHIGKKRSFVGFDLGGGSLHKRGYRLQAAKAPLKENLAAALFYRARAFAPQAENPVLIDPFCGSGTLLVEGLLQDLGIASQVLKDDFGFQRLKGFDQEAFVALHHEEKDKRLAILKEHSAACEASGQYLAYGSDQDERSLKAAQDNIDRAGLTDLIKLEQCSLKQWRRVDSDLDDADERRAALVLSNPPYGERLEEKDDLYSLYALIGDKLKSDCQGDKAAILCNDNFLVKAIGLQKTKRYRLTNGPLQVEWTLFNLYRKDQESVEPAANDAETESGKVNVWGKSSSSSFDAEFDTQVEMVCNRFKKNQKRLKSWLKKDDVNCYRLYDADIPEYAFAVDVYAGKVQISEYKPPKSVDEYAAHLRRKRFTAACAAYFQCTEKDLFLKTRQKQKAGFQYKKLAEESNRFTVYEAAADQSRYQAKYWVNLTDYLDTGLFLDHRPVRQMLGQKAQGKRVLNLFCYTATATVHMALGDAVASDSVDMSQTYINWAEANYRLNGLDMTKHRLHRDNVTEWVDDCESTYDLIFIDPPSFSNSKRMEGTWDVQRDHEALLEQLMGRLEQGGELIFSNNLRKFKLSPQLSERYEVENITRSTLDPDFQRNSTIHHCFVLKHR